MAEAKEKQEELDLQLEDQDVEVTIDDQPEDVQIDAVAQNAKHTPVSYTHLTLPTNREV